MRFRLLTLFFVSVLSVNCFAQIRFDKGYFINNSGETVDCLIRNVAWRNNPTQFQYKLAEEGQIQIAGLESVKEFGILGESKYVKFVGDIDRSSESLSDMSSDFEPSFQKEELFLKVVIEGKASLYEYRDGNLTRYFFGMQNSEISQLVYKSYLTSENRALKNKQYKKQLQEKLTCEGISLNAISELEYDKKELVRLFIDYNDCINAEFNDFSKENDQGIFKYRFKPGFQSASLSLERTGQYQTARQAYKLNFGSEKRLSFGVEIEYVFPFNKNKWSVIIQPTYLSPYKSEKEIEVDNESVTAKYSSIDIPLGIRHYFFLNDVSNIFVSASYVMNTTLGNSKFDFEQSEDLIFKRGANLMFGLGFTYNDKYSLQFDYGFNRELLNYLFYNTKYKTTSIVFGYKIF